MFLNLPETSQATLSLEIFKRVDSCPMKAEVTRSHLMFLLPTLELFRRATVDKYPQKQFLRLLFEEKCLKIAIIIFTVL